MKKTFLFSLLHLCIFQWAQAQAPDPTAQPTNMKFSNIKTFSLKMSFTNSTANGYLVLKSDKFITAQPVDGTVYEKGQGLDGAKVLALGSENNFQVREVVENTKYYFAVFAYNGTGAGINYLQADPLVDSVITNSSTPGNYYSSIDTSSGSFVDKLHTLIRAHTMIEYVQYKYNIIPAIFERDTVGGQCVVNCEYSNETTIYTPPFDFGNLDYSREHTLCKSWMLSYATYGADVIYNFEGSDYFNLLLTKLTNVNSQRSNYPEGEVVTPSKTYKECKFGKDATGQNVFEPREDRKGDVARAMMYEMVCYTGTSGGNWGLDNLLSDGPKQSQEVLKQWNIQDPPDKWERTKNEYIYSIQKNRNPFIDHPEWATCINFDNLNKTNSCGFLTAVEDEPMYMDAVLYPNPANDHLTVSILAESGKKITVEVFSLLGQPVAAETTTTAEGMNNINLSLDNIQAGNYLVKLASGDNYSFKKLLIVK